jgi:hypothetical protein
MCAGLTKAAVMDHVVPAEVARSVEVGVSIFFYVLRTG